MVGLGPFRTSVGLEESEQERWDRKRRQRGGQGSARGGSSRTRRVGDLAEGEGELSMSVTRSDFCFQRNSLAAVKERRDRAKAGGRDQVGGKK